MTALADIDSFDATTGADLFTPHKGKLSVGVALAGGAARGFAHIGVLRALIANGIKPDVVSGTSIGAVVGGCYAAGALDALEAWARELTPRSVLRYLDFSLGGKNVINGGRLAARLAAGLGDLNIQDLPMPFAAIATEAATGHEIWLTRGRLVEALTATYALPGIFPPVRIGGRWLMDGTLVNPLPISATRALGARLVIAINLNSDKCGRGTTIQIHRADEPVQPATGRRGLRGFFRGRRNSCPRVPTVMIDAFNIMQDRIMRSRLAGDPPDVLITPKIGRIGLLDFLHADEAIAIGEEAGNAALPAINDAMAALA